MLHVVDKHCGHLTILPSATAPDPHGASPHPGRLRDRRTQSSQSSHPRAPGRIPSPQAAHTHARL